MSVGQCIQNADRRSPLWLCLAAFLFLAVGLAGCGSEDTGAVQSCSFHSDCPVGSSCSFENKCIQAACTNCQNDPDLVCLVTDEHPDGVCSRPECNFDDDCDTAAGETCESGLCTSGGEGQCQSNSDCDDGETCNLQNECVPGTSNECADSTECDDGEICDETNTCVPDSTEPCGGSCPEGQSCNTATDQCEPSTTQPCGGSCPAGQTCNTATDQCEPEQTCDPACTGGQICDTTSGTCIDNNCPPGTPGPDDCTGTYDKFNADGCFCAQCLSDNDCDTAAGETCNNNGECMVCNESCDPADGGNACSNPGFYCVSNCCVECLGAADCPQGQVCVDGSCGAPPDCSSDPSVCTGGTVCNSTTGQCETQQTGTPCTTDADCSAQMGFCNTQTGQCESINPGGGGGTCSPACPGGASACVFGMMCTCPQNGNPFDPTLCPSGQFCVFGMCMAM